MGAGLPGLITIGPARGRRGKPSAILRHRERLRQGGRQVKVMPLPLTSDQQPVRMQVVAPSPATSTRAPPPGR